MKYEIKITLPLYKMVYSVLFMVIIVLVRPVSSYGEIIVALEPYVALLAGVFMADSYYQEFSSERISCYYRYSTGKKYWSVMKRNLISVCYLVALVAVFYWGFVLMNQSVNYQTVNGSLDMRLVMYRDTVIASAMNMVFMGSLSFTLTNLTQNIGIGLGGTVLVWILLTSTLMEYVPAICRPFELVEKVLQGNVLSPYYGSRGLYMLIGILLLGCNVFLIQRQPRQVVRRRKNDGNRN